MRSKMISFLLFLWGQIYKQIIPFQTTGLFFLPVTGYFMSDFRINV